MRAQVLQNPTTRRGLPIAWHRARHVVGRKTCSCTLHSDLLALLLSLHRALQRAVRPIALACTHVHARMQLPQQTQNRLPRVGRLLSPRAIINPSIDTRLPRYSHLGTCRARKFSQEEKFSANVRWLDSPRNRYASSDASFRPIVAKTGEEYLYF